MKRVYALYRAVPDSDCRFGYEYELHGFVHTKKEAMYIVEKSKRLKNEEGKELVAKEYRFVLLLEKKLADLKLERDNLIYETQEMWHRLNFARRNMLIPSRKDLADMERDQQLAEERKKMTPEEREDYENSLNEPLT